MSDEFHLTLRKKYLLEGDEIYHSSISAACGAHWKYLEIIQAGGVEWEPKQVETATAGGLSKNIKSPQPVSWDLIKNGRRPIA